MAIKRYLRPALGVAALGAVAAIALWPDPLDVDLATVSAGPMTITIDEDGETRVRDRFVISAPVSGRLQRIALEAGDPVRRGVVAMIAPADAPLLDARTRAELEAAAGAAHHAVGQARAECERAAAAAERAAASARRSAGLAGIGAVAREDDEASQTAARTAAIALQAAESALARAEREEQFASARLRTPVERSHPVDVVSPADGVVLKRYRESESVVAAGEALIEVGNPRQLEAVVDLLSTDAVRVRPGNAVSIEGWGGDVPLRGRVQRVEPSGFLKISALGVEEQRVNVIIDFDDAETAACELGDRYRVEARITIWQSEHVVKVPVGSLFRHAGSWAVFVEEGGRARLRAVEVGQRNHEAGEIIKGLRVGERVVLHPPDTLSDGVRIRVRT